MHRAMVRVTAIPLVLVAGLAVGGCSVLGGVLDQVTSGTNHNGSSAFSLKVGDCFIEPDTDSSGLVSDISSVECSIAHDDEAFASVLMTDAEFPGDTATQGRAEDSCTSRFLDFIGASADYDGSINFGYLFPTQDSWANGDREILCYAFDENGQTVGSLKGIAS